MFSSSVAEHVCDLRSLRLPDRRVKVSDGGAGLHPEVGAEGGAEVAVCERILRCTQPKERSLTFSPRHES